MSERDDDVFEDAMRRLGVRRSGASNAPRASDEDELTFEEAMRIAEGLPPAKPAPASEQSPEPLARGYAEEDATFLAAMAELAPPNRKGADAAQPEQRRVPSRLHGSPRSLRRRIRDGVIDAERELDLHRMPREQAYEAVRLFIQQAVQDQLETVRIICGRGLHSKGPAAVLPEALDEWLRKDFQSSIRQAVVSPASHGGRGAVMVILRRFVS